MAGMLAGLTGFNMVHGLWRTADRARGLYGPPNDFYEVRGNPSTEMSYEGFCAALEAAGVGLLRVKLVGWNNPIAGTGDRACAFEPPPAGTFNLWQTVLDPANLAQYRADQSAPPYPTTAWAASNVGQFVLAAERHGVKLHVILFDNVEFSRGWWLHAWNASNRYVNGATCQLQDRGFLASAPDAFTAPAALDAAKSRADAALALFEGHEGVVASWEVMCEQPWIATPDFVGTTWGSAAHVKLINDLRAWNAALARHIRARHPAPVGVSIAAENDVRRDNIRAQLFDTPDLDWVGINMYGHTPEAAHDWLRVAQARYPGKQMVVQQYHPSGPDTDPPESAPWLASKGIEWAVVCGSGIGPMRWPDTHFGTYASPNLREIAGVTAGMAANARLGEWGAAQSWDGRVQSPDLSLASAWGDGRHVLAFLRWSTSPPHRVSVNGLRDEEYHVAWYDWVTGVLVSESSATASGGALDVGQAVVRQGSAALLVIPAGTQSESESESASTSASSSSSASRSVSPSASESPSESSSESGSESSSSSSSESESESQSASPSGPVAVRLVVEDDTGQVDVLNLEEGRRYTLWVEME